MSHTEGPWHVQDNTDQPYGQLRVDSDWGCIAVCGTNDAVCLHVVSDESRANAALIAEAPAMLSLVAWLAERGTGWGQPMDAKVIEARSIISRAEGKS